MGRARVTHVSGGALFRGIVMRLVQSGRHSIQRYARL